MALSGIGVGLEHGLAGYARYLRHLLERKYQEEGEAKRLAAGQASEQSAEERWMRQQQFLASQRATEEQRQRDVEAKDPFARLQRAMILKQLGVPVELGAETLGGIESALPGVRFPRAELPAPPEMAPAPGQGIAGTALTEQIAPIRFGAPQAERTVTIPGVGPVPVSEAVKMIGAGGVRNLLGVTPPVSPAETRLAGQAKAATERTSFEASLKQLRSKLDTAVQAKDMARVRRVVAQMDSLNAQFPGLGVSGIDEYRAAKGRAEEAELTKAGKLLQHQKLRKDIAKPEGGATETLSRSTLALRNKYLSGKPLTPQEERILFGTQGEEFIPARDRQILQAWKQNLSPIDGTPIDKELDQKLRPVASQILSRMANIQPVGPAQVPPPAQPVTPPQQQAPATPPPGRTQQILEIWRRTREPIPRNQWRQLSMREQQQLLRAGVRVGE